MNVRTVCLVVVLYAVCTVAQNDCNLTWANKKPTSKLLNLLQKVNVKQPWKLPGKADPSTLKLLHVVFRHGDRTTDPDTKYPNDPYNNETYYPVGYGQLTNLGKKQEYNIGTALRSRYGKFLGDMYVPEVIDARSTDYNRTKMSLELTLAGLFPPVGEQIWNPILNWLPIPYNYYKPDEDLILGNPLESCPRYKKLYDDNLMSEENQEQNAQLKEFYEYLTKYTGQNTSTIEDVYFLYFVLFAEEQWGLKLPEWTKCVFPDKIEEVAIDYYYLFTQTKQLKRFATGSLMEKIWKDSMDMKNGKLYPAGRKIYLYSGHERNVALTLLGLNLFYPHVPPYSSYVVFEVHEINGVYGFKILYQDYQGKEPRLLTIPGCDAFCPFEDYHEIFKDEFPTESC